MSKINILDEKKIVFIVGCRSKNKHILTGIKIEKKIINYNLKFTNSINFFYLIYGNFYLWYFSVILLY